MSREDDDRITPAEYRALLREHGIRVGNYSLERAKPKPSLVGGHSSWQPARWRENITSAESMLPAVEKLLNRQLVTAESLARHGYPLSRLARYNEGDVHRGILEAMTGVLCARGYNVYPGDVGIRGIRAMADAVVYDERSAFFVEALTSKTIEMGGHQHKALLARVAPVCFVGPLPDDFFCDLHPGSYGIGRADSWKMHDGAWVPHFYRTSGQPFEPTVVVKTPRGGRRKLGLSIEGLRRPADVGSILKQAIQLAHARRSIREYEAFVKLSVEIVIGPGVIYVDRDRILMRLKEFHVSGADTQLTIMFEPFSVASKGSLSALYAVGAVLQTVGLGFVVD